VRLCGGSGRDPCVPAAEGGTMSATSKAWLDKLRKAAKEGDEEAKRCLEALEGDDADDAKAASEKERLLATRPDLPAAKHVELFRGPLAVVRWAVKNLPRAGVRHDRGDAADAKLDTFISKEMGGDRVSAYTGVTHDGNVTRFAPMTAAKAAKRFAEIEAEEAAEALS
jgi:hypothetical protein